MPHTVPPIKLIRVPAPHAFVFAVADHQLANFLILQGGARVLQIDAGPTVTLYHLQADIDLTPLIRHFTEAVAPAPAADDSCPLTTAARRAGKANRYKQVDQVLHEFKRRIQAALAQEKGRMRKAGLPEAQVLALLEVAVTELPRFIEGLNAEGRS